MHHNAIYIQSVCFCLVELVKLVLNFAPNSNTESA